MATEDRTANVVLTADTTAYTQSMQSAASSTNQVTESVNRLFTALDKVTKTTGKGLMIVSASTVAGITAATAAAAKLESQMSGLQARAVAANQAFGPIQKTVDGLRRTLPVTTDQVVALTNALQKLGTNPSQLDKVARTLIQLSGATGENLGSLASNMIQLQRAMGTSSQGITRFSDLLVNLSSKMGTSANGILEFSNSIAPIGRTLNMTQQEVMAFSAAFSKAGQDGYRASSIFTRLLSDISTATRYGTSDLSMYASIVGKTVDQFKSMGSTNQVIAIFDALNRGGASSIKTLERMGFEGAQALKAIQGTSQSGGLAEAMKIANDPKMQNGNTLERSQKAAFDGLNDTITKIRNNLTSLTQAFGAPFLNALNSVVGVLEKVTQGFVTMLQPIQPLIAALSSVAGIGTGLLGAGMATVVPMGLAAGAYSLLRNNFGAGRSGAAFQNTGEYTGPASYRRAARTMASGGGTPFARGLYAMGLGRGDGDLREGMGRVPTRWESMMFGTGRLMGMMTPSGMMYSISERSAFARSLYNKAAAVKGQDGFGGMFRRGIMLGTAGVAGLAEMSGATLDPLRISRVLNVANRGTDQWGNVSRAWAGVKDSNLAGLGRATGILTSSFLKFGRTVMSAELGLAKLAARAAMPMIGAAARGIGGGIMSLAGGVPGLALMGAAGLMTAVGHYRSEQDSFSNALSSTDGSNSAYNRYATALGLAGAAAQNFATTINGASNAINEMSMDKARTWGSVGSVEIGRELTDPNIGKMSETQAIPYVASALSNSGADTRTIVALQKDVLQKYNRQVGGRIWEAASTGIINMPSLYEGAKSSWLPWDASNSLQERMLLGADTTDVLAGEISSRGYGESEQLKMRTASLNAQLMLLNKGMNEADREVVFKSIASTLGMSRSDLDTDLIWNYRDKQGIARGDYDYAGNPNLRGSVARQLMYAANVSPELWNTLTTSEKQESWYTVPDISAQYDTPQALRQRQTISGAAFWAQTGRGGIIRQAADLQGNANAMARGTRLLGADTLAGTGGSIEKAIADLQVLKFEAQSLDDPKAILATATQEYLRKQLGYNQIGASTGQRVASNRQLLQLAAGAPRTDEYEANLESARDAFMGDYQNYDSRVRGIVRAGRQFTQSQGWQRSAFDINKRRQQEQFDLQKQRQDDDYARSRKWSLDDYNLARQRGDYDYNLSRERSEVQYTLTRQRSLEDYNKSRMYAEEDFNHQKTLMAEQSSRQMADIYQRVPVRPSWDAGNLLGNARDQAALFRRQIESLKKLRKMGISSASIKMLGLNDPANAHQTIRMAADLESAPELVQEFNQAAQERLDIAGMFTFDEDNTAWQEMERQFQLTADRNAEAFALSMERMASDYKTSMDQMDKDYKESLDRQERDYKTAMERQDTQYKEQRDRANEDFKTSLTHMEEDFNTSMNQSRILFNQQFEEITGDLGTLKDEALSLLSGTAKEQLDETGRQFDSMTTLLTDKAGKAGPTISEAFEKAFVNPFKSVWESPFNTNQYGPFASGYGSGSSFQSPFSGGGKEDTWAFGGSSDTSFLSGAIHSPVPASIKMGTSAAQKYGAPRDGGKRRHEGVDFPAPIGTPLYAVMPGTAYTKWSPTGGNVTTIDHGNGLWTNYLHQSAYSIRNGSMVDAGQLIGKVGNTGSASRGAHLHFEVRQGGQWGTSMDPAAWLKGVGGGGGGASDGNPLYMSAQNKKDWAEFVATSMQPVEAAISKYAHMMNVMPIGAATSGTLGATIQGINGLGYLGNGAIFDRTSVYGVGERGSEMLLPLDHKGVDFLTDVMTRYARGIDTRAQGMENVSAPTTYNIHREEDHSVRFTGPVSVEANDPNEMARKLEEKARLERLTKR